MKSKQKTIFETAGHIHFIGIGGIGVSAIARKFLLEKKIVSGSDATISPLVKDLQKLGARVWKGHSERHIAKNIDVVVYTKAVRDDNPELVRARTLAIPTYTYSQALGIISAHAYTIAVAGSHGKTTTTGLIAWGLIQSHKDPTVVVGSLLKDVPTNFIAGKSKYFVVEACEYQKSFLDLNPHIVVVTNIDNDHLDYYKTKANIVKAFIEFVKKIPSDGYLVTNLRDATCARVAKYAHCHVVDYTLCAIPSKTKLIGAHNMMNMQAAQAVFDIVRISASSAKKSLQLFSGTARRLEHKGEKAGTIVYDDYAHHPTEIKATLRAVRDAFPHKKIICVFQPHLYSRTKLLFTDFVKNLVIPDVLLVLPIYAAREKEDKKISSQMLVRALMKKRKGHITTYVDSFDTALSTVKRHADTDSILITMGAGEAYMVGNKFLGLK